MIILYTEAAETAAEGTGRYRYSNLCWAKIYVSAVLSAFCPMLLSQLMFFVLYIVIN